MEDDYLFGLTDMLVPDTIQAQLQMGGLNAVVFGLLSIRAS